MSTKLGDYARKVITQIDDVFIDEIGPVGLILCEEVFEDWEENLKHNSKQPSLRNMAKYVTLLSHEISDDVGRKTFLSRVTEIDSLNLYIKPY